MSSNSPFEAGDRVKVVELEVTGRASERLSWVGKVVSVNFPWIRVRDEAGTIYERHARALKPVDARVGRTALTSVGDQMIVIAPPRQRPRVEFDIPDAPVRRRRKGPAELAGSGVAVAPARSSSRRKTVSRLSELSGPTDEEKAAAKAFVVARREEKRLARKKKEAAQRRAAKNGETPAVAKSGRGTTKAKAKSRVTASKSRPVGAKSTKAEVKSKVRATSKAAGAKSKAAGAKPKAAGAKPTAARKGSKAAGVKSKPAGPKSRAAGPKTKPAQAKSTAAGAKPSKNAATLSSNRSKPKPAGTGPKATGSKAGKTTKPIEAKAKPTRSTKSTARHRKG